MSSSPICLIVGTRPEGIKMIPVYYALKAAQVPVLLCATMQHEQLLQDVFDAFDVQPDIVLDVMRINQDLFYLTQSLLQKLKEIFGLYKPSLVLVQGDTTSAMVGALAAFYYKIPVGHIEAGLRTDDLYAPFPEEMNRRVISVLAQFHFAPTQQAYDCLLAEHIAPQHVLITGNTVVDALRIIKQRITMGAMSVTNSLKEKIKSAQAEHKKIIVLTMHRRESLSGGVERVLQVVHSFLQQHPDVVCFYPLHPNPCVVQAVHNIGLFATPNCYVSEPLAYQDLIFLLDNADVVLTDSGGIQEEAVSLGKAVLILREKTERSEGIKAGLAWLVGTDPELILQALQRAYAAPLTCSPTMVYGDGFAAEKIVTHIKTLMQHADTERFAENKFGLDHNKQKALVMNKKVSVLGLGYIGLPTAVLCADAGFSVFGFDIDAERVEAINSGDPVIQETDLTEKLMIALGTGRFVASTTLHSADYYIIAVPTPFKENKKADLRYVMAAAESISHVLKQGNTVILESTVPVGTTALVAQFLQDKTGLVPGKDFYLAYCPERVLPGQILKELVENDRVIGGYDTSSLPTVQAFYAAFVTGQIYLTNATSAEMVKLIENSSRDVQIAFAHQVASMAYAQGLDPYEIIALANKHPRVNILNPTCGVGGHCIAVDPWFLIESFGAQTALLQAARMVNDTRPFEVVEQIFKAVRAWQAEHSRACTVLLMGQTYKPDVDDMRESPAVRIADTVREHKAIRMLVCEPYLNNKTVALYGDAAVSIQEGLEQADMVVFLVAHTRFKVIDQKLLAGKRVLDFCGINQAFKKHDKNEFWPARKMSVDAAQIHVKNRLQELE